MNQRSTIKQRIIQLAARYVSGLGLAMLTKVGIEVGPDNVLELTTNIEAIFATVMLIGGQVIDLLIHKVQTGGVLNAAGESKS